MTGIPELQEGESPINGATGDRFTATSEMIDVVGCMDHRYARHFSVVMVSACLATTQPERLRFWLVSAEPWGEVREPLQAIADQYGACVQFLTIDVSQLAFAPTSEHITLASYYRILLPAILPATVRKFIYLDADVVVRGDLQNLFSEELSSDQFVGAVENPRFKRWASLGMRPEMGYFNAGILLVNLELWRQTAITTELIQFIRDNIPVLKQHDQDTLNAVFAGRWKRLDLRWNQQYSFYLVNATSLGISRAEHRRVLQEPHIVHYSGGNKPWLFADDHPFRNAYFAALDQTNYRGWRPKPESIKDWLKVIQRRPVPHRLRSILFRW